MTAFPRNTIVVSVLLISMVAICVAFSAPPERKYKNLKILSKNISEKELDSVMHTFTRGLGVRCDFCHVPTADRKMDFASDEKPEKNIARKMMKMANKINKKYFNYINRYDYDAITNKTIITCNTCHRGLEKANNNLVIPD